jgi:hypothetical protein
MHARHCPERTDRRILASDLDRRVNGSISGVGRRTLVAQALRPEHVRTNEAHECANHQAKEHEETKGEKERLSVIASHVHVVARLSTWTLSVVPSDVVAVMVICCTPASVEHDAWNTG